MCKHLRRLHQCSSRHDLGLRLCTRSEVKGGAGNNGGFHFDWHFNWLSTSCAPPTASPTCVASACREYSPTLFDSDCCGLVGQVFCADGYTYSVQQNGCERYSAQHRGTCCTQTSTAAPTWISWKFGSWEPACGEAPPERETPPPKEKHPPRKRPAAIGLLLMEAVEGDTNRRCTRPAPHGRNAWPCPQAPDRLTPPSCSSQNGLCAVGLPPTRPGQPGSLPPPPSRLRRKAWRSWMGPDDYIIYRHLDPSTPPRGSIGEKG
eukprot:gene10327-biopygen6277